ncbi:major tail protein [Corynebacterium phage EmiRose]|uniref:Major tail protein n=1 Tax=Corynebacterium phage EmiRose TaxID=2565372 RepID=A0A649VPM7_9CAUD|nr:major tail protein [Corynebacterium phage EmiRose]QGJ94144.1 major tail protein [Corynebacterium phage EmiRose]
MTAPIPEPLYRDDAVFQPGQGAVLTGEVGTEPPSLADIRQWVESDRTGALGDFEPIGYTSLDDLPGVGNETEGGEKKGVWENPDFRLTPITSTDTVTIKPVQWTEIPLSFRFGKGVTWDKATGRVRVPKVYTPVEVSILVVILDGDTPLVLHYPRGASSPDDDLELDPENFVALPVKFTVLNAAGATEKMNILAYHLQQPANTEGGTEGGGGE